MYHFGNSFFMYFLLFMQYAVTFNFYNFEIWRCFWNK
jgi:hypothetical protein